MSTEPAAIVAHGVGIGHELSRTGHVSVSLQKIGVKNFDLLTTIQSLVAACAAATVKRNSSEKFCPLFSRHHGTLRYLLIAGPEEPERQFHSGVARLPPGRHGHPSQPPAHQPFRCCPSSLVPPPPA